MKKRRSKPTLRQRRIEHWELRKENRWLVDQILAAAKAEPVGPPMTRDEFFLYLDRMSAEADKP